MPEPPHDAVIARQRLEIAFVVVIDEIFDLRQALGYELRVVNAHIQGRSRLPKGLFFLVDELTNRTKAVLSGAVRAAQREMWSYQPLLVRTGTRPPLTGCSEEGELVRQRLRVPDELADVATDDLLPALSMALSELYFLRAYAAHLAGLVAGLLAYKAFPASRRGFAQLQIDRLLDASCGWVVKAYGDMPPRSLSDPGMPSSEMWRRVVVGRLSGSLKPSGMLDTALLAPSMPVAA